MAKESAISPPAQAYITSNIRALMFEYGRTGKIGNSKPKTRNAALRRAIAVSFSRAKQEGYKVPKKAEEYHSEVFSLEEEVIDLLNNCYERGYHRFEPNPHLDINDILIGNLDELYLDNYDEVEIDLDGKELYEQLYGGQSCLDCGAELNMQGLFTWPNHPDIEEEIEETNETLEDLINYGPHTVCEVCNEKIGDYYDGPDEHGIGKCVAEQIVKCDDCGEGALIGEFFDFDSIDIWNNSHGESVCVPIKKGDFTIQKVLHFNSYPRNHNGIEINYATVEDYEKIHGGENPLSQDGRIYALTVKEINALEKNMVGNYFENSPSGGLKKAQKIQRLGVIEEPKIIQKTVKTPLNVKSIKKYLEKLQRTNPDKHDEVIEELFGAEGLTTDTYKIQDSFIRNIYDAHPKNINSRNSLKIGGERFNFSEGNISGYVLRKNDKSMDILISDFEGMGYFMESGEQIDSGEKLKGKVVLDIANKSLTLDNDVWRDETTWSDSNKSSQQDSWQLDWDAEGYDLERIVSMTNIEKIFIATAIGLCIIVGNKK